MKISNILWVKIVKTLLSMKAANKQTTTTNNKETRKPIQNCQFNYQHTKQKIMHEHKYYNRNSHENESKMKCQRTNATPSYNNNNSDRRVNVLKEKQN